MKFVLVPMAFCTPATVIAQSALSIARAQVLVKYQYISRIYRKL